MRTSVVVIGAGQAGLAMSRQLAVRSIDHVVVDRGQVAHSWRTERWDSLRLLTPNWMSRLPGQRWCGPDPDGFMGKGDVVELLATYAEGIGAPVQTQVEVTCVRPCADGFEVVTDRGTWWCDAVVVATGAASEPHLPAFADELPATIAQLTGLSYRNPAQLDGGAVLVVGASASGVQIADELRRGGRDVVIAVGDHVRLPRRHRGRDIHWWMDAIGQLDERYDEVDDIDRARRLPSLQLVGSPDHRTLDLNALVSIGVAVVGKLMRVDGRRAQCSGGLAHLLANADLKQARLLDRLDEFAVERGFASDLPPATRPPPTSVGAVATELDLGRFATVVWATGYRPTFPWLDREAFDQRGRLVHDGGVGAVPGLYFLGLPFMRRRKSSFIDGVGPDSAELVEHLHAHLDRRVRA